jgi:capsular polysaccharide transport system permease protein
VSSQSIGPAPRASLWACFTVQFRVIGAVLLREMHTRYGRDNIGYVWMVAEPMLLATVIGLLHTGQTTEYGANISPMALAVFGYTVFIMFRGIVNRSEGAMEANGPLLYHRMVTVDDVVFARALLEAGGTTANIIVMLSIMVSLGLSEVPARPLWLVAGVGFLFWMSTAQSLIVVAISHDNKTLGRLIHIYTYFMIPLSGAFFQMEWIPTTYRYYLLLSPMPHIFEIARYGEFQAATDKYFDVGYLAGWCTVLSVIGLLCTRIMRRRMHLS